MKEIIIATTNKGKLLEFTALLPDYKILSNRDIEYYNDIEETGTTLQENAMLKAKTLYDYCKKPVIAEDSGLFVEALQGAPGIYSARYAGAHGNAQDNIDLLLKNMDGIRNRYAYFMAVICYYDGALSPAFFEGKVEGEITEERSGNGGFGYDPVFVPLGYSASFAELSNDIKNTISHRAKAIQKLMDFLK